MWSRAKKLNLAASAHCQPDSAASKLGDVITVEQENHENENENGKYQCAVKQ